jgi:nitrous oxidase accessory protein NosD
MTVSDLWLLDSYLIHVQKQTVMKSAAAVKVVTIVYRKFPILKKFLSVDSPALLVQEHPINHRGSQKLFF